MVEPLDCGDPASKKLLETCYTEEVMTMRVCWQSPISKEGSDRKFREHELLLANPAQENFTVKFKVLLEVVLAGRKAV